MNKFTHYFLYGLVVLVIGLSSCAKDGDMGPQGPPGTNGLDGLDGIDGLDGNANVTSILFENVAIVVGSNDIDVPEITQDIFDSGLVYAFAKVPSAAFWEPMPIASGGNIILDINRFSVGSIQLTSTFSQNLNIRIVLVESSD